MFIFKFISIMLIFISLRILFSTVFQFFQYFEKLLGSYENVLLKYRKETNIVVSSFIGCSYLYKNMWFMVFISTSIISEPIKLKNHTAQSVDRTIVCSLKALKV